MIVVLKDGRTVQKGKHEQLLLEDGLYRELYAMQLKEQKEKFVPNYDGDLNGISAT
jgi:ABC-type transport system involved in cytochrome bd biosynthesis fused ATPase/permease subunit